jgi:hypothetical protein
MKLPAWEKSVYFEGRVVADLARVTWIQLRLDDSLVSVAFVAAHEPWSRKPFYKK